MEKLVFTLLLIVSFCKAADDQYNTENMNDMEFIAHIANTGVCAAQNYYTSIYPFHRCRLWWEIELNLNNRQLKSIPNNLYLPSLIFLNLENNEIATIPTIDLPRLTFLNLKDNRIANFDNINLPNLRTLDLENNLITNFDNVDFPNLEFLNLKNNLITNFDNINLPNLRSLNLENNRIETFNHTEFLAHFPALTDLNLNYNPINQENVDNLTNAANAAHRIINIIANDIGDRHLYRGISIKRAK